jgi:hypothetical protein
VANFEKKNIIEAAMTGKKYFALAPLASTFTDE